MTLSSIPVFRAGADVAGAFSIVGTLIGALPAIGALLAVIWYLFQIYESPTFAKIVGRLSHILNRKQMADAISKGAPVSVDVRPVLIVGPVPTPPLPPAQSPAEQEPAKPA